MKSTLSLRNWEKIFRLFPLRKCPIAQASWFWTDNGRACGRCAPTRKLWKHAGAENQNEKGLCDSGYFPLGRSPLFACYDFLKYGYRNPTGFRRWVKVAESGGLCYTCVMGTWKSKTDTSICYSIILFSYASFVCKYRKKLLMSKQISDDIIGQSILFGRMDSLPAV